MNFESYLFQVSQVVFLGPQAGTFPLRSVSYITRESFIMKSKDQNYFCFQNDN